MTPSPRCPLWGWTEPVRVLLTIAAAGLALLLGGRARTTEGPTAAAPELVVDPNTAPPEVLAALPRLGPKLVQGIVAARRERPFRSLDDIDARVRRIGP